MSVWGTDDLMHIYNDERKWEEPLRLRKEYRITVLTGAGISAESGVPTFRGSGGLWTDKEKARLATPGGFAADPEAGWRFYDERRQNMKAAEPNPAHFALARLESEGYDVVVITQNIDRLHQRAGSSRVVELHGSLWRIRCSNPECSLKPFENTDTPLKTVPLICDICGSHLRPDVVFFEELLDSDIVDEANRRTKQTDIFMIIGTSGLVYPAAGFARIARAFGAYVIEFNIEPTPLSSLCNRNVYGPCGQTLPETLTELTGGTVSF